MKKLIVTVAFAFGFVAVLNAQDLTSKKGEPFLPKQGEWAIGIDAAPFLPLLGNGGAPSANFLNNADKQIVFKAFLQDNAALRIKLRIGMNSTTEQAFTMDDQWGIISANMNNLNNPGDAPLGGTAFSTNPLQHRDPTKVVTDEMSTSQTNINLSIGYEMRRGTTRLQGFFGGELMLGIGSGKSTTFTYGNAFEKITDNNPGGVASSDANPALGYLFAPTFYDFNGKAVDGLDKGYIASLLATTNNYCEAVNPDGSAPTATKGARNLEVVEGGTFGFGLRGFIGAEYFILPKMSVGVEYGWGLGISSQGNGSQKFEYWGTSYNYMDADGSTISGAASNAAKSGYSVIEATVETAGKSGMSLDTDLSYGAIFLNLHF